MPKGHVCEGLRTQTGAWGRRDARVRYVELRVPCADGTQAYVGNHTSNQLFPYPHYLTQVQQPTGQIALSRTQVRGPRATRLAYRGVAPVMRGERKLSLTPYRCPIKARTTRYPIAKSY